jgi:hypothetical protein
LFTMWMMMIGVRERAAPGTMQVASFYRHSPYDIFTNTC